MRPPFLSLLVIQSVFIHKITCGNAEIKDATLELLLAKFEHLEGKLKAYEETNNRQQVEIEMLKNQILQNKEEYKLRSRRQNEDPIAFYGKMMNQHTNLSTNSILKFNNVVTNVGSPYSQNNGLFIAPVPGIYVFSTTIMIENRNDAHVGIYVNDKLMTNVKLYGSEHQYDTMSQTAIYKLQKNDTVSVRRHEGSQILHFDYTSFSGFLLQEYYSQTNIIG